MLLLAAKDYWRPLGVWEQPLRALIIAAVLWLFSRHVIDLRVRFPLATVALGVATFLIWIGPDMLFPGYRTHWLFQNSITGQLGSTIDEGLRRDPVTLAFRSLRAIVLVPILEELFWRAWLMRWLIDVDFERVPLGAYTHRAMILTAVLFASEHGPYWDVGLAAGLLYNWWLVRTKRLGDCILAHAITNGCLSAYVMATGRWEYWF